MPAFDVCKFDFQSTEDCARFHIAVIEASADRSKVAEQVHNRLCDAMCKPLKASRDFLQCLTDLLTSSSLPPEVVLQNKVFQLSMDQDGSRLVQASLQASDRRVQGGILSELRGHVCEMLGSPHANHVLQCVIELLPPSAVGFIFEEISQRWEPEFLAKHKFGCRVFERMIEHFPCTAGHMLPGWTHFLDRLLSDAAVHCFHAFATFIMQHLMEHGGEEHKQVIVAAVMQDLERSALDSHASGVLDKALSFLPHDEQLLLASKILEVDGLLGRMAASSRPAAERLFRVVSGPLLVEAHCQMIAAFPDCSARSRVLKSMFGSKIPSSQEGTLRGQAVGLCVLTAPAPMSMAGGKPDGSPTVQFRTPHQQTMVTLAPFQSIEEVEAHWWNGAVSQVFGVWSNDPWEGLSWTAESVNYSLA